MDLANASKIAKSKGMKKPEEQQKNHRMENDGKARMSIRDFSESLTSNESHGYVCTLIYELSY